MDSRSHLKIDHLGLNIPAGAYALPTRDTVEHLGPEAWSRFTEHFAGRLPLAQLTAAETGFLREHFLDQAHERREESLAYFGKRVPRRYAWARPDERTTAWAQAVVENLRDAPSLLLLGPTGTGKTHSAYGALYALADSGARIRWQAYTEPDLFSALRPREGVDSETAFARVADCDLLFLDDLGVAKLSDWTEEITYRLINHRYDHCLPGIFTSNVVPEEFEARLGARIVSRLRQMCQQVSLKGPDRREARR